MIAREHPTAALGHLDLIEKELTEAIIGACMEVSNELGSGFLEVVYRKAVVIALAGRSLKVQEQVPLDVHFRGYLVGEYFADLLVEGRVIVELKAAKLLTAEHEAQLINYLRATGVRVGLLVNFGRSKLEWRRLVF